MKKYKISSSSLYSICFLLCLQLLSACSKTNFATKSVYQFTAENNQPDYNNLDFWAAHPWKHDPSDSVPKPLLSNYQNDSLADVFFVHPTTLTSMKDNRWNATIDDASINAKTDYSTILYQASAFNENSRVFAPRYRQAHIRSFFQQSDDTEKAFEIAYADVKAAFENYLATQNNNRPIIIASHSQGTKHAARLLKEFFDGKPLAKQLVCAYIIGLPIPENYFTNLKTCTNANATGCIISWRTFKNESTETTTIQNEKFKAIVVNPLTWSTTGELAARKMNIGGVLTNFNKIVPGVTNAQIHGNILWSSKPNIPFKIFFTRTNYHIGDINLFYMNIRENVNNRINTFVKNN